MDSFWVEMFWQGGFSGVKKVCAQQGSHFYIKRLYVALKNFIKLHAMDIRDFLIEASLDKSIAHATLKKKLMTAVCLKFVIDEW